MADVIAISDRGTMLYKKVSPAVTFSELVEVTSAPASGADAPTIEVTTLKSEIKQYIADRKDTPAMNFNYNYTEERHETVLAVCNGVSHDFLVIFQDGSGFQITGTAVAYTTEVALGSAIVGVLNITASAVEWLTKVEVDALIGTSSI